METGLIAEFIAHLQRKGLDRTTIEDYHRDLSAYLDYTHSRRLSSPFAASADHIQEYYALLGERGHTPRTVWRKRHAVYAFYEWLHDTGRILVNPALKPACKIGNALPRNIPETAILRQLYERLGVSPAPTDRRDLMLIDLAYSCGLRRCELHRLNIDDIDADNSTIRVRGKGGRERIVPIGKRCLQELLCYVYHTRPRLMPTGITPALFVSWNQGGKRMHLYSINAVMRRLRLAHGLPESFKPHALRHAYATHMVRNGAPIQDVSKMLGHARLQSTQVYTHLTQTDLKRHHAKHHPRG